MSLDTLDSGLLGHILNMLELSDWCILKTACSLRAVSRRLRDAVEHEVLPGLRSLSFRNLRLNIVGPWTERHKSLVEFIRKCEKIDMIDFSATKGVVESRGDDQSVLEVVVLDGRVSGYRLDYCTGLSLESLMLMFTVPGVKYLSLRGSEVSGEALDSVPLDRSRVSSLEYVDLSWCREVSNEFVNRISRCFELKYLSLRGCTGVDERGLELFTGARDQTLAFVGVKESGRRKRGSRESIESLNIAFCQVDDDVICRIVERCPRISVITLAMRTNNTWYSGQWTDQGILRAGETKPGIQFKFV